MTGSRVLRIFLVGGLVLVLIVGVYGLALYLGVQSGREVQADLAQVEQAAEIGRQLDIAQADILRGNYGLALRRLEWVLEQSPENPDALALRSQAESALDSPERPAGTPDLTTPSTRPTATPVVLETGEVENVAAAEEFGRLQSLADEEAWPDLIPALLDFQRNYPNFQRRLTDEMLFNAYNTYGVDLLYTEKVELGLYYLRRAEQLGDLPQEVADQKLWAELYLGGISFYGADWGTSILFFRELCPAAPFFQNACERLVNALMALGDQYAARGEWCPAVPLYAEAFQQDDRQEIANKLSQARQGCANATPTPSVPLTGTLPITSTLPITGALPFTGTTPITIPQPPPVTDGP